MEKFYVIANSVKDKDGSMARRIAGYLQAHGKICLTGHQQGDKIPPDMDCIIVLGGDGTLLRAAREAVELQIPLLGINLGTLGYLAEIDKKSIYPALDSLMQGDYEIERRMMLKGRVYRKEELLAENIALNDIVISRDGPLRVLRFTNRVNNSFLNTYTADGIIVSSPTGSTGYSLSAGGPIISPSASLLLLTPLAPHTLNSRSIVFSGEDKITVELGPARDGTTEYGVASFDGGEGVRIETGDRIEIEKSEQDTRIVKISNSSFLETLRLKMGNH